MANSINNLSASNTFLQWLTATQSAVALLNNLTEGGPAKTFVAITNVEIANNVTISGDLTVSGNITLDAVGYDNLVVSGDLNVVANSTLNNATIAYSNQEKANITLVVGSSGNFINSSFAHSNSAYAAQNTTGSYANSAFLAANTATADALAFAIALG